MISKLDQLSLAVSAPSETVLKQIHDVVFSMVYYLDGNHMFHDFTTDTGERYGPVIFHLIFLSFLKADVTLAVRQSSGTSPVSSDLWEVMSSSGAMSSASSFNTCDPKLSGPGDLFGLRSFSSFMIPIEPRHEKTCFSHMLTINIQISLHISICASWKLMTHHFHPKVYQKLIIFLILCSLWIGPKRIWVGKRPKRVCQSLTLKYSRCPPPPKPVYGGNFSHEAVTLKIRLRSPKSNTLLILSD